MERMEQLKAMLSLCLIFGMAFCLGSVVGHTVSVRDQAVMARPAQKDWGLSFQEDNKPPVADESTDTAPFLLCKVLMQGKRHRIVNRVHAVPAVNPYGKFYIVAIL